MRGIFTAFLGLLVLFACPFTYGKMSKTAQSKLEKINEAYRLIAEAKRLIDAKKHCAFSTKMHEVEKIMPYALYERAPVSTAERKSYVRETIKENDDIVAARPFILEHSKYDKYARE